MADLPSGDPPVTNGTIQGLQGSIAASGEQRDAIAGARDLAALVRDRAAEARDRAMTQDEFADRHDAGGRALTDTDRAIRAKGRRKRAARHRAQAAEYRDLAAQDRQAAARDREQAARDRSRAATGALTGARAQTAGLADLDRELNRCRRTNGRLVVAFVAVAVDDGDGHDLSDERLERVTASVTSQLRSYDVVIRLGGDRLLCAMSNMALADARERFTAMAAQVTDASGEAGIQTGFADVAPYETATALIARAEQELIAMPAPHIIARRTSE